MAIKAKDKLLWGVIIGFIVVLGILYYLQANLKGWFLNPTANAKQMVLVTAKDWSATTGKLQRFERNTVDEPWQKVGESVKVNLGGNGMGWGIGLHGATLTFAPEVIEGAKRTPVGVFKLALALGKYSKDSLGVKLPYKQITKTVFCSEDPGSQYYNHIVDTKEVKKDWNSAEDMYKYMQSGIYRYALVVEHNYENPIPGRGSCYFVHVYSSPEEPTFGCTAFAPNLVRQVMLWLDPAKEPILVQLPETIMGKFKGLWQLPG
jgi:L,D-peptidoglycan transpeptidase YkuD (ErfK/YbiS/YcfS/YnhG family)